MAGFLLALLAVLVTGIGARDQAMVAELTARQGARPLVLVVALGCALGSALAAGWAGIQVAPLLAPRARVMLVAMVLALAVLELLFVRPLRKAEEPTHSLFAFGAVLLAQQLTDAARLVIFALAAWSVLPAAAVLGGVIGAGVTVLAGWLAAAHLARWPVAGLRRVLGLGLAVIAAWLAL